VTARLVPDLVAFFAECVYPAEAEFAAGGGTDSTGSPVLAKLREEARRRGLWNLFSSLHPAHGDLDAALTADLAEIVGRSPVIGQIAVHSLNPDAAVIELVAALGSAGQRARWLPGLADGVIGSAYCMTEPGVASSDPRSLTTRGERDADGSVLVHGVKSWCTGAGAADCRVLVVLALTAPDARPAERYSLVLVPRDDPGVSLAAEHSVLGYSDAFRGGHPDLVFTAARGELLGEAGGGLAAARRVLGPARMLHCMRLVGTAARALGLMCARFGSREVRGRPLTDNDLWIDRAGAARISIEAMRALVRSMASGHDQGIPPGIAESVVKAEVPSRVAEIVDLAIQAHGADGLSAPGILADLYAHARSLRISDGPDEVHRRVVGRHELGRRA
jgi:acyl-CoA dehydrogenase